MELKGKQLVQRIHVCGLLWGTRIPRQKVEVVVVKPIFVQGMLGALSHL